MFPAIKDWFSELRQGFGNTPEPLDLKFSTGETIWNPSDSTWYERNGFRELAARMDGAGPAWSGERVNEKAALSHSVPWACTRVISETEAFMPLSMMQEVGDAKQTADSHPTHAALHNAPNDEMSAMTFRETLTAHLVTRGNCYARIVREKSTGRAMEFWPIDPTKVDVCRKDKQLTYEVSGDKTYTVKSNRNHDILHVRGLGFDGTTGYSVITMARQSIGAAISAERYAAEFYRRGGRQPGYIKTAQKFRTQQDAEAFRGDLEKFFESGGYHRIPIFPPDTEFSPYAWSPQDSQFLETRQWTVPELCRWFLMQPHMVGDLSRATFNNIEHLALQFVKLTMTAWVTRWEQDLWRCVLTPEEKRQGYYFKHNVNGLLRGDFQSRMAGYATLLQNGVSNVDEVRAFEDWNPLPTGSGKAHHIQLNMQTLPGTGTPTTAEMAALAKTRQTGGQPNAN